MEVLQRTTKELQLDRFLAILVTLLGRKVWLRVKLKERGVLCGVGITEQETEKRGVMDEEVDFGVMVVKGEVRVAESVAIDTTTF